MIDILMATYNGEKYIRNQLLSLQQQTHIEWTLWIRDDGSNDNTLIILNEFAIHDSRIKIVNKSDDIRLGPGKCFLELTKYSNAAFAIFCDQDDIWFEKKLEFLYRHAVINFSQNIPSLVYCDAYGYSNAEGVVVIDSISKLHANSLREFLFFNAGYQGCSMLFNRVLCSLARDYRAETIYMHDDIVSLLAHSFGKVYFLSKCLMLYRQHESNVTGNIRPKILDKIKRIFSRELFVLSELHFLEKKSFFEAYRNELSEVNIDLFRAYLSYPFNSLFIRLWIVLRFQFSIGGYRLPLLIKTLLRRPLG